MNRREFVKCSILPGLALAFGNYWPEKEKINSTGESLVDVYLGNVKGISDADLSTLLDPALLKSAHERKNYVSALNRIFVSALKGKSIKEISDIAEQAYFIYDEYGNTAVEKQVDEFRRDASYYEKYKLNISMGGFNGKFEAFLKNYEELKKEEDGAMLYFTRSMRALVPFSAHAVGSKTIHPVYFFPFWFEENFLKRGAKDAAERKILTLSDIAHEFGHVLFNYAGFTFDNELVDSQNARETLNIPSQEVPGILRLISEVYGTECERRILSGHSNLAEDNSSFREKVRSEFTSLFCKYPLLEKVASKIY